METIRRIVVYIIKCNSNQQRYYVGSTVSFDDRKESHLISLRNNKHHSVKLQNHVNKYGIEDIYFEILEECEKENLIEREQHFIDTLTPYFNTSKIAGSSLAGLIKTEEWGRNISNAKKGKSTATDYTRQRLKETHTNKTVSEETRQKLREGYRGTGMTGRKHSFETREKMRLKQIEKHKQRKNE